MTGVQTCALPISCNLLFPFYDEMLHIYKMIWFAQPFYTGRMKIIIVPIDLSSSCYSLIFPYFLLFLCNLERGLLRAERVVRLQQLVDQGLLSWTFPEPYKKGKNVFFEIFFLVHGHTVLFYSGLQFFILFFCLVKCSIAVNHTVYCYVALYLY